MQLSDYMGFFLPKEGTKIWDEVTQWRASYAMHHARIRGFAIQQGATGIHLNETNGTILGLAFDPNRDLPAGWKWKNALKEYAVPHILGAEKIVDIAAARRVKDFFTELGSYEPQADVVKRCGFIIDYEWEWESTPPRPYSTLGPEGIFAQVVFVGDDGPICIYAPHAQRAHAAFYRENIRNEKDPLGPPKAKGFKCVNGADVWQPPVGVEEISKSQWELLGAQYKVAKEESARIKFE